MPARRRRWSLMCLLLPFLPLLPLLAQSPHGTVRGTVTRGEDGRPLRGALVIVDGTTLAAVADPAGRYVLTSVPAGRQTLLVRAVGFRAVSLSVTVAGGGATLTADAVLPAVPQTLTELIVTGASRNDEPVLDAPAAVVRVTPAATRDLSLTGQAPRLLLHTPGVYAVQTGVNDWNVTTRGFNTTNNRRVLVLQDGRDLALAFLGSQEWFALSTPLESMGQVELIRGPGSALYGPNAYSGVLAITTPSVREAAGTRVTWGAGEVETLRGDVRHGRLWGDGRFGFRAHAGVSRSDTWSRSRTNLGDFSREYRDAIDTTRHPVIAPFPGFEVVPLNGQKKVGPFGTPGPVTGDRDQVNELYGGARFDYYATERGTFTVEAGGAETRNETIVTGVGRIQITHALRPWARAAWTGDRFSGSAYWSGRRSDDQFSLSSGAPIRERSSIFHVEGQFHQPIRGGRGRVVLGTSARGSYLNSDGTLLPSATDERTDRFGSLYGQIDYEILPRLRLLAAARLDDGNLYATQLSPKGGLVYKAGENHAFRFTVNRAFQTPNTLEYFINIPAGPPADFGPIEAGLRASPLGDALSQVPEGTLFTTSSAVPILALGNRKLSVEHVTSYETGYKGQLGPRLFVTADFYYARLSDFVTDLLPGANPQFGAWTAPAEIPEAFRPVVEGAVRDILVGAGQPAVAAGLTRLEDGRSAVVFSIGNAGRATEKGVELGLGVEAARGLHLDANYAFSSFDVDASSLVLGDQVLSNVPKHQVNVSAAYAGAQGLDGRVSTRLADAFDWSTGVFAGRVPSSQTVDAAVGYRVSRSLRLHAVATNLFDQRRYQLFGGSIIGRRVLAGATADF